MVLVVGDIEADELVVLAVLALDEREDQAAVLVVVVLHLQIGGTVVFQPRITQVAGIADGHGDVFADGQLRSIEIAGAQEDAHHIIDTVLVFLFLPMLFAVGIYAVLLQVAIALGVGIPQLVDIIAVSLAGSLAEIQRGKVLIGIAYQGVAHDEHVVQLVVATGDQAGTEGVLAVIARLHGRHGRRAYLHPDEFPVEIEVVADELAALEGGILDAALGECR